MKKSLIILGIFLLIGNNISYSQNQKYQFEITSKSVEGEIYPIEIVLPDGYDSTKKYPIVYFTDWWFSAQSFPFTYNRLRMAGVIEPFIMVGISTKGDMRDWRMERLRDLTPTNVADYDVPDSLAIGSRGISGGAANFLSFIKNELIPVVEAKYPSDTLNRGYVGYSLGGLFGACVLVSEPQIFQHYLLGSPSLKYDNFVMINRLKETNPDKLLSVKSIFITVGEEESGDYLKGFADFRDLILKKDLPNLELKSVIIDGEGHLLAASTAMIKGLKFMYGTK